jgi:tetratricopeptide (TPR) repeat protein
MLAMLSRLVSSVVVVAILFGVVAGGAAQADDRAKAKESYRAAIKHYRLAEYDQALDAFKEAYRNYSDGSFLFNIGMCHKQLGHKPEAVQAFKSFLAETPNAPNRDEVVQLIATIQTEIDAEQKAVAPPPEVKPTPVEPTPAVVVTEPAPVPEHKPVYKKWWLWTTIGAVVVVGVGVGLGVGLTRHSGNGNTFPGVGF